jgi:predicted GNAT family N-acyltransferase
VREVRIVRGDLAAEDAFKVRKEVFLDEQGVSKELEFDEMDRIAFHFIMYSEEVPIGTARLFETDGTWHVGRMAILKECRGKGFGRLIMKEMIDFVKHRKAGKIVLHAQISVLGFYRRFGFLEIGDEFLEAGIRHKKMICQPIY